MTREVAMPRTGTVIRTLLGWTIFGVALNAVLPFAAHAEQVRFDSPTQQGAIVDWCATWATDCGAGGANLLCRQQGYSQAVDWATNKPGRTYVIGSKQICQGDYCVGFTHVTCANENQSRNYVLTVQAKSFIKGFSLRDPAQYDPGWFTSRSCIEPIMAAVVECGMLGGENPTDGSLATGNYRLRSEFTAEVTCSGNKITNWNVHPVATNWSGEFLVFSTTGEFLPWPGVSPAASGSTPIDQITIGYGMRGKPNIGGNILMWITKNRTCPYIWHRIQGTLTCQGGVLKDTLSYSGSSFPSHRFWTNNVPPAPPYEISQGPFRNLWICDPNAPEYVK